MIAASTSASSGLMTSSRSSSVLDGAICSSGMSSPVPGSRYWTRLWWDSSVSSSTRMPVCAQHLHCRPGPERAVFLAGQVAAVAGGGVLGPDPGGRAAWSTERRRVWPAAVNCSPGAGAGGGREQRGGVGRGPVDGGDQGGEDRQPLAGPLVHAGLAAGGSLPAGDIARPGSGRAPPTAPSGPGLQRPLGDVEVEGPHRGQAVRPRPTAATSCLRRRAVRGPCSAWSGSAVSTRRRRRGPGRSESMPGWWFSRSFQNSLPEMVGQAARVV